MKSQKTYHESLLALLQVIFVALYEQKEFYDSHLNNKFV